MKILTLEHNENIYAIKPMSSGCWLDVFKNDKQLAKVMSIQTARQVIFNDINSYSEIGFLNESDFEEEE